MNSFRYEFTVGLNFPLGFTAASIFITIKHIICSGKSIKRGFYADTVPMSFPEVLFSFTAGGVLYVLIELIYRKHSHISMFFVGGLCFMLLHALFTFRPMLLILKCVSGMFIITAVEFLTGAAVNIKMKRNVWDYSKRRFNLYGQICLKYSLLWGLLTVPVSFLSEFIHKLFV